MDIEIRISEGSRFEQDFYYQIVLRDFDTISKLLPIVYRDLSQEDLDRLHIIVVDGADERRSFTKPHKIDPFRFGMCLVPEDTIALAEVIAHELCHVVQFFQGRIKALPGRKDALIWEGEVYDLAGRPYSNRPWEQEAMLNANILHSKMLS